MTIAVDPERATLLVMSVVHRNALVTALTRSGWPVVGARGFEKPLDRLHEAGATGVIVDLRDDGNAGLAAIRALSGHAKVMAIVPNREVRWIAAAIDAGADHYLTTPVAQVELAQAVRLLATAERAVVAVDAIETVPAMLDGAATATEIVSRQANGGLSVLMIAATRFDMVNAAHGRGVGDQLIGIVGQRILHAVRGSGAAVAHVGGAEFAVLGRRGEGTAIAHAICNRIDRPFMVSEALIGVGCRIGVVDALPGETPDALLRRAAQALAEARAADGASIVTLGTNTTSATLFDAALEPDLRRAVAEGQIEVLFQPQVAVTDGLIVGVEALARWTHPLHGTMGAEPLFAAAARSDYTAVLSEHVQDRALALAASWPPALSELRLAINLTSTDLAQPDFAQRFLHRVAVSGFSRERLTVEITEGGLIDNLEAAAAAFAVLRGQGLRIAIDDFGTGYSSLAWLKSLPLDYLKIDKGLAHDIGGSPRDRVVVRGVIDMARALGLAVVAEGVEHADQLALLAAEGCTYWQGYLCAPPLSDAELIALVRQLAS